MPNILKCPHRLYKLNIRRFFLLANASVSPTGCVGCCCCCCSFVATPDCPNPPRVVPVAPPADMAFHVARSPDNTKDMTRVDNAAHSGPNFDCDTVHTKQRGGDMGHKGLIPCFVLCGAKVQCYEDKTSQNGYTPHRSGIYTHF